MVLSVFTPQVCPPPALTEVNLPRGGLAWPCSLSPQQATVPSVFTPQVWAAPALTEVKARPRSETFTSISVLATTALSVFASRV
jgi:hypothetical protein